MTWSDEAMLRIPNSRAQANDRLRGECRRSQMMRRL
jgi:hypothetical protein